MAARQLPPGFDDLLAEIDEIREEEIYEGRRTARFNFRKLLLPLLLLVVVALLLSYRLVKMSFMTATIIFYAAIAILSGVAIWRLWVALT